MEIYIFNVKAMLVFLLLLIRVSASASVLPMNIQDRFPIGYLFYIWYYCFFLYKTLNIQFLANSAVETLRFICIMIFAKFTFLFFNLLKTFRLNTGQIHWFLDLFKLGYINIKRCSA